MSACATIHLRELTVGYGRQPVLQKISLTVRQGSCAGLLGANGSGKTTLLKTIAGILPPLEGEVVFEPAGIVAGYVPQRESIDAPFLLSSFEVAMMGLTGRLGPGRRAGRREREFVVECLRRTGAEDLARKPFSYLSGGQKQRVLIARALATRPDALLLDEPTAGIDPDATQAVAGLLRELNEGGMTILMVNHDLPVVRQVADTVLWVRHGKVEQGPAEKMLSHELLERVSLQME